MRRYQVCPQEQSRVTHLLQNAQVDVKGEFGFELVGQKTERGVNVASTLDSPTRPAVIVPAQHSTFHPSRHFMMSHVSLRTVEQALELESVGVSVRYHISDLTDDCGEYEHAN
jgi:hypothetical protein